MIFNQKQINLHLLKLLPKVTFHDACQKNVPTYPDLLKTLELLNTMFLCLSLGKKIIQLNLKLTGIEILKPQHNQSNLNLCLLLNAMLSTISLMLQLSTIGPYIHIEASTTSTRGMECALTVAIATLQILAHYLKRHFQNFSLQQRQKLQEAYICSP